MSNLVIVAIPDENDRVWKVSSEKVPHLTLLFLGEVEQVGNLDQIMQFVEHAANTTLHRFYLPVDRRGELGADQADVLFFKKGRHDYKAIRDFRATLLQDNNIKTAYDSATQFEGPWQPHLTLGYPATPAKKMPDDWSPSFYEVQFNKIAVWTGDSEGLEILLKDYWDEYDALETVPMDVAMSDIQHHGVKGMRWGVRNAAKKVGGGLVTVGKDIGYETERSKQVKQREVTKTASAKFHKEDLPRIDAKYKGTQAGTLKGRLKNPFDKDTRAYRQEARIAFRDRINEAVAGLPTNASGTRKYDIEDGGKTNSQYTWKLKVVDVKKTVEHADTDMTELFGDFEVRPVFDEDGFIIDIELVENTVAQTIELGAEFLEHYGVKGMQWGVRNKRPMPTAVAPTATSKVPNGARRKTKIETQGGENHPASEDAIKVAQAKVKLKKSGTAALSNKELQDLQTRLNLERNVKQLVSNTTRVGKGRKFVKDLTGLNKEINDTIGTGYQSSRLAKQVS